MIRKTDEGSSNRLAGEKSPYLLQHASNPVDWYPWSEEAFEKAKREDRPIFLSIGYSTCHWCHVMAHESFEDPAVAKLMNETFVNIKLDREERPDIDSIYMTVCQAITGSGGWPLTVIMTPEGKPFFAATYIPRESRYGRVGMIDLIPKVRELWKNQRQKAVDTAENLTEHLKNLSTIDSTGELGEEVLKAAFEQLSGLFDERAGGFSRAPKFPTPHNLLFLLRYWKRTGDNTALTMVEKTLSAMRLGGIFDHIGFGFHRYSTDQHWLVPHFEKMLYDQAMLAIAYTEAYQATKKTEYREVAGEILAYALRDMQSPEGGFYSAEDADSEGVEGKFYTWTLDEIKKQLEGEEAELMIKVFNVGKEGNFLDEATKEKTGKNILHLRKPLPEISKELDISMEELKKRLESAREKLFSARNERVYPGKDEKILCDWNGLMIAALAIAARVFDERKYAEAAGRAADFVLSKMTDSKEQLLHRYMDREAGIQGFLDDYAALIWGLLELYETTFDVKYLSKALTLSEHMTRHFRDSEKGGFYFTSDYGEEVLVRKKEVYDGAHPSGNSMAALNLLRLSRITGDPDLEATAVGVVKAFSKIVRQSPGAYTYLMCAVDFMTGPSYEIVIAGDKEKDDAKTMFNRLRSEFIPNMVVLHKPGSEKAGKITKIAGFTEDMKTIDGRATAYVCSNQACNKPTTDPDEMMGQLQNG